MQTYIVYITSLLLSLVFAKEAERTKRVFLCLLIASLLSFVAGFRAYSVGIDTMEYVRHIKGILRYGQSWGYGEIGFQALVFLAYRLTGSYSGVLVFCALITNFLIILRLWDFREIAAFPWMVATYYIAFFFDTMNMMRQYVAVAIVFYATRFIERKKYVPFLAFICVSTLFHKSGFVGVLFFMFDALQWKYLTKTQKLIINGSLLFLPAVFGGAVILAIKYSKYIAKYGDFAPGLMLPLEVAFLVFGVITLYKKNSDDTIHPMPYSYTVSSIGMNYLVGIAFSGLGYFVSIANRVGFPFYLFKCVFWGLVVKNTVCKQVFKVALATLLLYLFVLDLTSNGQGQIPYVFIWQSMC